MSLPVSGVAPVVDKMVLIVDCGDEFGGTVIEPAPYKLPEGEPRTVRQKVEDVLLVVPSRTKELFPPSGPVKPNILGNTRMLLVL